MKFLPGINRKAPMWRELQVGSQPKSCNMYWVPLCHQQVWLQDLTLLMQPLANHFPTNDNLYFTLISKSLNFYVRWHVEHAIEKTRWRDTILKFFHCKNLDGGILCLKFFIVNYSLHSTLEWLRYFFFFFEEIGLCRRKLFKWNIS